MFYNFLVLVLVSACSTQEGSSPLTIGFTGDVILDRGVADELHIYGDSIFVGSVQQFTHADYTIVNYEGTFTRSDKPQNRKYLLKAPPEKASLLTKAAISHVSIANNHVFDFGSSGYKNTIEALKKSKLEVLGLKTSPTIIHKKNYRCGILSASLSSHNDSLAISSEKELKESVSHFSQNQPEIPLVLYLHWGFEHQTTSNRRQRKLAKELIQLGADAIIGHHPHVTQPIEYIDGKPVFYSLGNFVADAYLPNTNIGYTVQLSITDKVERVEIQPFKIKNYFPRKTTIGFQDIIKHLSHSKGISAMQSKDGWTIKASSKIDFMEDTSLWLIAGQASCLVVKKLINHEYLMSLYYNGKTSNTMRLIGIPSEIQLADIDNNGSTDILFGLSKKVHFDPVFKKRINIFSYRNGNLQARWLGTKFVNDVVSFDVEKTESKNYLTTIEQDSIGKQYNRKYEWNEFGFALVSQNQLKAR